MRYVVQLICTLHLDVLTLAETWLDDTVSDGEVLPVGFHYSVYHQDRNRHGGGVAIVISSCIPYRPHLDLSSGQTESIWGELYPRSKRSSLLCCAYQPSFKMDFFDNFIIECENGSRCSCKILIMGDFNSDVLSPQLPECRLFKRFISNFDLQDMFTGPTQVTESSSSHLDVFLTIGGGKGGLGG